MSEHTDCKEQSKPCKRRASPEQGCPSPPDKAARVREDDKELALDLSGCRDGEAAGSGGPIDTEPESEHEKGGISAEKEEREDEGAKNKTNITNSSAETTETRPTSISGTAGPVAAGGVWESNRPMDAAVADTLGRGSVVLKGPGSTVSQQQSDWAAIAAAEALASLTRGDGDDEAKDRPRSGSQGEGKRNGKRPGKRDSSKQGDLMDSPKPGKSPKTRAAAADSSTSLPEGGAVLDPVDRERSAKTRYSEEEDEEEDDSLLSSSSSADFSSGSEEGAVGDSECAIVSVKMAPETRQAVAQLARLQMQLETLERRGVRQHQRLELRLTQQRRPHLEQRSAVIRDIPGFWVTALLNHPQLSSHIDENDEDALSYMTNLEIENSGLGYKIGFHFRRNPYFQNSVIVKERHLAVGGSALSFSNPILWHRGQNLTARGRLVKGPNTFHPYQSFFTWFSDHSSPERDQIAEILKNDLYRNPLRYYLTPLWEPRLNGSTPRMAHNSNSSECVVISDSDDDDDDDDEDDDEERRPRICHSEAERDTGRSSEEEDEEVLIDGSEEEEDGESADEDGVSQEKEEEEELDVEEVDTEASRSLEPTTQPEEEEDDDGQDIEVDEDDGQDIEVDGGEEDS
ncbi:hypothetical protein AGOR_G00151410 [Albula goreensis]|uniref:Uncharacterized protein n=1 Tax=Albula goreensis TaxID=1534307 RepID=A0A8T3D6D3_9TELE|nr:hypothetical protein AGOR_G00151410 [Albula goreensis]